MAIRAEQEQVFAPERVASLDQAPNLASPHLRVAEIARHLNQRLHTLALVDHEIDLGAVSYAK
jgi:hypothetical protein